MLAPILLANNDELPDPAVRLHPAAAGAFLLPISLFGIGWTGQTESVHWIVPIVFSAIFPLGAMMIFPPVLGYLGGALSLVHSFKWNILTAQTSIGTTNRPCTR